MYPINTFFYREESINTYNQYQYSYPHKNSYYPIDKKQIEKELSKITSANYYVHFPFCSTKCGFCNLFSITGYSEKIDVYLLAIKRQYAQFVQISKVIPKTLILGGGTPVLLSINQFDTLFNTLSIDPKNQYSAIELSPNETSKQKLEYLKSVGFNRVSIGIQSFDENELKMLQRQHKPKSCQIALEEIVKQDFSDFNIDLIYGIKGQSEITLQKSLEQALKYNPTEIFIYPLYIRKNTSIFGNFELDQIHTHNLYLFLKDYLLANGFIQRSMRCFTRKKIKNITSCGFENNLAFGCGGRSYLNNLHCCEPYSDIFPEIKNTLNDFLEREDFLQSMVGYKLNDNQLKHRFIVKNLLHLNGIRREDYKNKFSSDISDDYKIFKKKELSKYISYENNTISLKDFSCSDFIIDLIL